MNNGEKNDKIKKILFNKNRKVGISSQNIMKKDEKIYKRKKKLTFLSAVPVSRCEETTADYKEQKERKKILVGFACKFYQSIYFIRGSDKDERQIKRKEAERRKQSSIKKRSKD